MEFKLLKDATPTDHDETTSIRKKSEDIVITFPPESIARTWRVLDPNADGPGISLPPRAQFAVDVETKASYE
jgi:hypothetical protein